MEPDPSAPEARLRTGPTRNSHLFRTSAGEWQAPIYRDLAAKANAVGFAEATPSWVHACVLEGLLPLTGRQVSLGGRRGFRTEPEPGSEAQLLALCAIRRRTKSHRRQALLLWLDGWLIAPGQAREAVLAWLPRPPRPGSVGARFADKLDEMARRRGPKIVMRLGTGRLGPKKAAEGTYAALSLSLLRAELDETAAVAIEEVAGIRRARTDMIEGVSPWLANSPEAALNGLARAGGYAAMYASVEGAVDSELDSLRPRARLLAIDFPRFIGMVELFHGRNVLGLGLLGRIARTVPEVPVAAAIWLSKLGLGPAMDSIAEVLGESAEDLPKLIALGQEQIRRHPDGRAVIRREGLDGLQRRGRLVPLPPDVVDRIMGPSQTWTRAARR